MRVVRSYLAENRLFQLTGTPAFKRPAYYRVLG